MSRRIEPKASVRITEEETELRKTEDGKLLFTTYQKRQCALLIQNDRLIEAFFLPEQAGKIGAIYIGKVKNMVKNIEACFVEIAAGEICFLSLKNASTPYLLNRIYDGRLLEGDELLVQVIRDAQKTKKASVTAHISLASEYFSLSMGSPKVAYSLKLSPEKKEAIRFHFTEMAIIQNGCLIQNCANIISISEAKRMTEEGMRLETLKLPPIGFIVRTKAGELERGEELLKAFFAITSEFIRLLYYARYRSCFSCLKEAPAEFEPIIQEFAAGDRFHKETDIQKGMKESADIKEKSKEETENVQQELKNNQIIAGTLIQETSNIKQESTKTEITHLKHEKEIITDQVFLYGQIKEYCSKHNINIKLRLYQDDLLSLSKLYSIESKLSTALESRVWLKSGGYLVIEPTEALTVIDVNSGKYETDKEARETYLKINLEAAKEVALQLRLRNLSGIIIVDFINMQFGEDRKALLDYLKRLTAQDKIQTKVIDMTPLGLVEITRKKINKPLREQYLLSAE